MASLQNATIVPKSKKNKKRRKNEENSMNEKTRRKLSNDT